jgi:hypothetical protein
LHPQHHFLGGKMAVESLLDRKQRGSISGLIQQGYLEPTFADDQAAKECKKVPPCIMSAWLSFLAGHAALSSAA